MLRSECENRQVYCVVICWQQAALHLRLIEVWYGADNFLQRFEINAEQGVIFLILQDDLAGSHTPKTRKSDVSFGSAEVRVVTCCHPTI